MGLKCRRKRCFAFVMCLAIAGAAAGMVPAQAQTTPREIQELNKRSEALFAQGNHGEMLSVAREMLRKSEVQLGKLNADWVVLSACTTAAGDAPGADAPGADALSGLARAFFYAGARALMVSHWQVDSATAVRLTTSAFAVLQKGPELGRSEALRRAMIAMIDDASNPWSAYPDYWAPFSVVGDGGGTVR